MTVKRITSKKPHRLIQDNDCHWYLIPYNFVDEFHQWIEDPYEQLLTTTEEPIDFDQFRINGPHTLKLYSWAEE